MGNSSSYGVTEKGSDSIMKSFSIESEDKTSSRKRNRQKKKEREKELQKRQHNREKKIKDIHDRWTRNREEIDSRRAISSSNVATSDPGEIQPGGGWLGCCW